nr:MAG TPA: hypothetical protein [Caudoviricetes sp.]
MFLPLSASDTSKPAPTAGFSHPRRSLHRKTPFKPRLNPV